MRTELFFPKEAEEERRAEVRGAFVQRELDVSREGYVALKSAEILGVRLDVAFIVAAGVFLEGVLFEAEKQALQRGIQALRAVWRVSGTVTLDTDAEPRERIPTIYFVPSGDEGDMALDAILAEYEPSPPGQRLWLPNNGWVSMEDLDRIQSEIDRARAKDSRPERRGP